MDGLLSWGLNVVKAAQSVASPFLTTVMKALSFSGTEYFFFLSIPFVYWCVDKRRGLRLGILVFLSSALNLGIKAAFSQPRPYHLDPTVGIVEEQGYGLPSGHSQTSVVFWGSLTRQIKSRWRWILTLALPFLVGLSRIYLGVHFPTDVLAGWAIGAGILALDHLFGDRLQKAIPSIHKSLALAIVASVTLLMNIVTANETSITGAIFGLAGASIYASSYIPFSVLGSMWKRALRYICGIATTLVVYFLPKLLLTSIAPKGPPLVPFVRYALLGAWIAAGAPWLFLKIGLAETERHSANEKDLSVIEK